ncbi:MAG: hypothetical protein HY606_10300, partial [Planctomycetes bacterium]|nr:hypothetical protein [Planctomycetota bacterium]
MLKSKLLFYLGLVSLILCLTTLLVVKSKRAGKHLESVLINNEDVFKLIEINEKHSKGSNDDLKRPELKAKSPLFGESNEDDESKRLSQNYPSYEPNSPVKSNVVSETEYSKEVKKRIATIKKDWEEADVFDTPIDSYLLLGKIKNAKQVVDYIEGKAENPLKEDIRELKVESNGVVTLGPSTYGGAAEQNENSSGSSNGSSQGSTGQPTNWGIPGIIQANIDINTGNMEVGWGGNGMNIEYQGTSTLESQSSESLIYNIGGADKRVIMGMNQVVEELIIKNDQVTGNYNAWYKLFIQKWVKCIDIATDGYIELRDANDNSVMKVGRPEAIDA